MPNLIASQEPGHSGCYQRVTSPIPSREEAQNKTGAVSRARFKPDQTVRSYQKLCFTPKEKAVMSLDQVFGAVVEVVKA